MLKKILIICFSLPCLVSAKVVINEIAWMGTENSSTDEWIELYSDEKVDLKGWRIKAEDGSPEILLKGIATGYFLLERTDDNTLPDIKADLIYVGALSNKGETLNLINNEGDVVDEANFSSEWTFGDNESKKTLERKNDLTWQTSQSTGGTPRKDNSVIVIKPIETKPVLKENLAPKSHLPTFIIATIIALFSAGFVLYLKKKN